MCSVAHQLITLYGQCIALVPNKNLYLLFWLLILFLQIWKILLQNYCKMSKVGIWEKISQSSSIPIKSTFLGDANFLITDDILNSTKWHSNSTEWSELWMRGDEDTHRLEKNQHREELTLKRLKREDKGEYKVLDEQGLAISTIQLSVEGKMLCSERGTGL